MSGFAGKTVLITGSSRGIGRDTALSFAAEGANLCINYASSAAEAEQAAVEIEASGGKAICCKADISNAAEVDAMVAATIDAFGRIDILVNNAGLSIDGPFLEMSEQDWDAVCTVNLKGPFLVSQAVARHMLSAGSGVIVNISATTTIHGRANAANYCCSKAGLNMLTKCMALELGPQIRVNGIGLGFVESPLVHEIYSDRQIAEVVDGTPLKRMTSIEETANFIKLLASDSTAFVTGQTIMFDGGRVMR
jgi:3-oxoacyl-[acyl-carrier protein] reductase